MGRGNRPMPFFSLSPQGRGNRPMPFLFIAPARFSPSPTGEREPSDAVFIHCSGPLLSLSHWREGTIRCRFYSLLWPAFLTLPLERGNRSMSFLFTAPARFSHSPTGEREPFDTVFIHCSGSLFSLSHGREGTVRCRFIHCSGPLFSLSPRERVGVRARLTPPVTGR